jgi:hypothetical protein
VKYPLVVVALAEFMQGGAQFFQIAESPDPDQLLFEGAKEALDTAIGLH